MMKIGGFVALVRWRTATAINARSVRHTPGEEMKVQETDKLYHSAAFARFTIIAGTPIAGHAAGMARANVLSRKNL